MSYLIAKTLHLLCVFAWFAGLTYLPRLLVAAAAVEPQAHAERQRLLQLASGLCRFTLIVTAPLLLTGLWLWMGFELKGGWLHYKATLAAGLFAYALMAMVFGPGTINGFSGSLALAVLMVPIVVRATEELLRIVPNELREASYALGVPKWRTITSVVLPTAVSGIVSGVILAIARIIGETAPLMIAAGFTNSINNNPFANPMMTLPVFVYDQYAHPGVERDFYNERAWAGALTLIVLVMLLNLLGRFIAKRFAPKTGR